MHKKSNTDNIIQDAMLEKLFDENSIVLPNVNEKCNITTVQTNLHCGSKKICNITTVQTNLQYRRKSSITIDISNVSHPLIFSNALVTDKSNNTGLGVAVEVQHTPGSEDRTHLTTIP